MNNNKKPIELFEKIDVVIKYKKIGEFKNIAEAAKFILQSNDTELVKSTRRALTLTQYGKSHTFGKYKIVKPKKGE